MAIRTIQQLKAWFSRGRYPVESQFADWLDSFFHKSERIPVSSVENLPELLNGKYDAEMGGRLEGSVQDAISKVAELEEDVDNAFEGIADLENHVENNCIQKTTRLILHCGSPADLIDNNK